MILAYSLRESFDRDNPWVRRLTGFGGSRSGRSHRMGIASFVFVAVVLAAMWAFALKYHHRGLSSTLVIVSYTLTVFLALSAPATGAAARGSLESDPCLRESLASPATDRQYVAALHGCILMAVLAGLVLFGVSAAAIGIALRNPNPTDAFDPPPYILHLYFRFAGFGQVPSFFAVPPPLVFAAALATTLSYAAGAYLHATLLASISSLAPKSRSRGGMLTVAVVAAMPLLIWLRLGVPAMLLGQSGPPAAPDTGNLLVLVIVVELAFAATRLWLARVVWRRMERTAIGETRRWIFEGS